jgi:O-antigen/teichoic acid export membrane protein
MFAKVKQQLTEGKNLMTFVGLRFAGQLLGIVLPFVVAKFFSSALFGSYLLARMVVFFVAALTISSAQTPFIVHANQERNETGKINKSFSIQCIFLGISLCLFFVMVTVFAGQIAVFAKISRFDLIFVSLAFVGFVLQTSLCNLFMALGQRTTSALAALTYNFFTVLFVIIFCLTGWINLRSVFLVYFLSAVLVLAFFIRAVDYSLLGPYNFNSTHFRKMLDFTKWLMLSTTAAYFVNWGGNLVLRIFVSIEDIGDYGFGYTVFKGLIFLTAAIGLYFLPFISQHLENKEKLRNYLSVKRPKIIALGLVALVCVFFVFPHLRRLIYGDRYLQSEAVLQILLIANVTALYSVFHQYLFNAMKKYKLVGLATVVQVVINIILSFVFIPYMGIVGAAVATTIAFLCRTIIFELYFRLHIRRVLDI